MRSSIRVKFFLFLESVPVMLWFCDGLCGNIVMRSFYFKLLFNRSSIIILYFPGKATPERVK